VQPRWAATRKTQAGLPDGHDTAPPHPCTLSAYSTVVANQTAVLDEPGRPPDNPATVPRGLDPVAMRAWRTFLVAHAQVTRQLGIELEAEQQLPLASYDVLVQLAEVPGRSLRMSELAQSVLLSRSGVTRLVDRLQREGLVERRACPDDARGTLAVLTDAGLARLSKAWVTHQRGVREHVVDRFTEHELETLTALLGRLVAEPPELPEPAAAPAA